MAPQTLLCAALMAWWRVGGNSELGTSSPPPAPPNPRPMVAAHLNGPSIQKTKQLHVNGIDIRSGSGQHVVAGGTGPRLRALRMALAWQYGRWVHV